MEANARARQLVRESLGASDAVKFVRVQTSTASGVTPDAHIALVIVTRVALRTAKSAFALRLGLEEVLEVRKGLCPAALAIVAVVLVASATRVDALKGRDHLVVAERVDTVSRGRIRVCGDRETQAFVFVVQWIDHIRQHDNNRGGEATRLFREDINDGNRLFLGVDGAAVGPFFICAHNAAHIFENRDLVRPRELDRTLRGDRVLWCERDSVGGGLCRLKRALIQ